MYSIAIDSGGTKISGAVISDTGEMLEKTRYENTGKSGDFFLDTYRAIIQSFLQKYDVSCIGIGCNGAVDTDKGLVVSCSLNYKNWVGRPIRKELEERFGLPVYLGNDCRAAIAGEEWVGAAKGYKDILGIFVGTGLGGCYIHNGEIVTGSRNAMGEVGHGIMYPGGRPCSCGQRGCAERYVSGTALWTSYNDKAAGERIHSGYEFFELYRQEDARAIEVLNQYIWDFSILLATCAYHFDPDVIVIGGGLIETREYWWDDLLKRYYNIGAPCGDGYVPVLAAQKGNDAALYGAARTAFRYLCAAES
ncbi:ROK family protein [Harryflintia acetispora]|uniref:Glucokinase n=1 Tax=Harryflintia acetispora TaxID=1849041 RepID=A0A9X8UI54_9FIRM|nr:ROK family protein [Harryflintia acetispora]TCL42733.1 glucokinase [Harryflintia acetispora]